MYSQSQISAILIAVHAVILRGGIVTDHEILFKEIKRNVRYEGTNKFVEPGVVDTFINLDQGTNI